MIARSNEQLGFSTFEPIEQLQQPLEDVTLLFLAQNTVYSGPVYDAWFGGEGGLRSNITDFIDQRLVTVLRCAESQIFCNDHHLNGTVCATVQGHSNTIESVKNQLALNKKQAITVDRIFKAMNGTDLWIVVTLLGTGPMLITRKLNGQFLPSLQDGYWQSEVENWFALGLANLQLRISRFVTGYNFVGNRDTVSMPGLRIPPVIPLTEDQQWMCESQIIFRDDYASFSVLGISMIVVLGISTITTSALLPSIVHHVQPATELNEARRAEWRKTEILELQRQFFNAKGFAYDKLPSVHCISTKSPYVVDDPV